MDILYLFHRYRDDVYRLAVNYTRNTAEAEDVCQTVFLKLLEQKHIQSGKEKAWLMQVTANQCRSLLRSGWWKKTEPLDNTVTADAPKTDEVLASVMELPPIYRVVIFLHYYEGYSTQEIASLLRIPKNTVCSHLKRGRELLKLQLQEADDNV